MILFWGTRENAEIFQVNKGTGTPPGRASFEALTGSQDF